MCCFPSHFLWPEKNWQFLTVWIFIFPLWEPHSRIIFLSQTNELQRVHYVAAPKQEAGVSDGKSWFYIMRDAWGCTYLPCIAGRTQQGLFLPILGLCSAPTATPSDLDDQAPFPGEVLALTFGKGSTCRGIALTFLCFENWHSHGDRFQVYSLPTYPRSIVSRGWLCLGTTCRWAQPQRESPVTFYEYHQKKKRACPRVQMWVICGQVEGKWHLSCCRHLQAHPFWIQPILPF